MHIKDISNEQCAQFVEDYLSNIKNDNFSSGPITIKKIKRTDSRVQVFAEQLQKHLVYNAKRILNYVTTFESVTDGTLITTLEKHMRLKSTDVTLEKLIMNDVKPMKLDISEDSNKYFEEHLEQPEESILQK